MFAIKDEDIVDGTNIYAYDLPAGGAGIHHPLLPHMSHRNMTERDRRVLILRYTTDRDTKNECYPHYRTKKLTPKRSLLIKPCIDDIERDNENALLLL